MTAQPVIVALSDTRHEALNQTTVSVMQKCNDVSPNVLGSIYDVTVECRTRADGHFLFVYMEETAILVLLEVEVFEGRK